MGLATIEVIAVIVSLLPAGGGLVALYAAWW